MIFFSLIFSLMGLSAWAGDAPKVTLDQCLPIAEQPQTQQDVDLLETCSDFFWHHQQHDRPEGSYNLMLKLEYRLLELEPQEVFRWSSTAWVLWSKWVVWKKDPQAVPAGFDGEGKDAESIALLRKGRRYHETNFLYHWNAGLVTYPLARFHHPDFFPFVIESFQLADQYTQDTEIKIRARLFIAYSYKHTGKTPEATDWFHRVLDLDPDNHSARDALAELAR